MDYEDWCSGTPDLIADFANAPLRSDEPRLFNLTAFFSPVSNSNPEILRALAEENLGRSGGTSLGRRRAFTKLWGESCERFALANPCEKNIYATYSKLLSKDIAVVNPDSIAAGTSTLPGSRHKLVLGWTEGYQKTSEKPCLIPTQLVNVPYKFVDKETILRSPISTGAAAHRSIEEAEIAGALEVIERDAFMRFWLTRTGAHRIAMFEPTDPLLLKTFSEVSRFRFTPHLFLLDNDFSCYVVLCILEDALGRTFTVGANADTDKDIAALGAIEESLMLRPWLRQLKDDGCEDFLGAPETLEQRARMTLSEPYVEKFWGIIGDPPEKLWSEFDSVERKTLIDEINSEKMFVYVNLTARLPKSVHARGSKVIKCVHPGYQPLYLTESLKDIAWHRLGGISQTAVTSLPHPFL